MPASEEEIEEATEEHIAVNNGWGPKRILSENGAVTGVESKRCTSVFNAEGRFSPQYDESDTIVVPADAVLVTIGQSILWGDLLAGAESAINRNGTLQADGFTYQSAQKDVFTAGTATQARSSPSTRLRGQAGGHLDPPLCAPGQSLTIGRDRREYKELDKKNAIVETYEHPAPETETLDGKTPAEKTFRDLRGTLTEEQVRAETARCLGCGVTLVDQYMCVGCGQCTTKCKFDAIHLVRRYDGAGVEFTEMKTVVIKQILKRKGKIAIKKVKRALGAAK
jgi:NADPH-dependent glutamate synthase beta subunit-like oxidoreductase